MTEPTRSPSLASRRPSAILCYLAQSCLPHRWGSLIIFVADVSSKVTGTNSTAGLLTPGKPTLDMLTVLREPTSHAMTSGECNASCLHTADHRRSWPTQSSWAHLTFPQGLGGPHDPSKPTSILYLILESSNNETHRQNS